jgi:uncharacterized membrane protein
MTEQVQKTQRSIPLSIGATLIIIAGVLSLINGVEGLHSRTYLDPFSSSSGVLSTFCGVVLVLFGVIAIAGGLYAFTPKPHLLPVLLGAALGMLGGGDVGFWFGLAAIALCWWANSDL